MTDSMPPEEYPLLNIDIDLKYLTVGEIELIEEKAGLSIDTLGQPNHPKGKLMRAIGWILERRKNPEFTYEEAGNLRISFEGMSPVPPTQSGDFPQSPQLQSITTNPFPK